MLFILQFCIIHFIFGFSINIFCCPTRCQPPWNDRRILQIQKYLQKYRVSKRMMLHWKVLENGWQRMLLTSAPRFEWTQIIPHQNTQNVQKHTHADKSSVRVRQSMSLALSTTYTGNQYNSTVSKLYPHFYVLVPVLVLDNSHHMNLKFHQ